MNWKGLLKIFGHIAVIAGAHALESVGEKHPALAASGVVPDLEAVATAIADQWLTPAPPAQK